MARDDGNVSFLKGMEGAHEKIIDKIAKVAAFQQPYVMNSVLDALMEDSREESVDLTDEDIGLFFMLLKTEIEVLDNRA